MSSPLSLRTPPFPPLASGPTPAEPPLPNCPERICPKQPVPDPPRPLGSFLSGRIDSNRGQSSPLIGQVCWSPIKSIWVLLVYTGAVVGGYQMFRWDAFALFGLTTAITVGAGYSVGIHRRLIHNSFQCPLWLEGLLVYLGVLVGLGGPYSWIERHDLAEWARSHPRCHRYFSRRHPVVQDWLWQLHCDLRLSYPPIVRYEPRLAHNRFYQWLEQTWMLQQLPWALLFYHWGGWSWVFWGFYGRVAVSITGLWLVDCFSAHLVTSNLQPFSVLSLSSTSLFSPTSGLAPYWGLLTLGECWQRNHQRCPDSARFGFNKGQYDPGWWFIKGLGYLGLAWHIQRPKRVPAVLAYPCPTETVFPANRG